MEVLTTKKSSPAGGAEGTSLYEDAVPPSHPQIETIFGFFLFLPQPMVMPVILAETLANTLLYMLSILFII